MRYSEINKTNRGSLPRAEDYNALVEEANKNRIQIGVGSEIGTSQTDTGTSINKDEQRKRGNPFFIAKITECRQQFYDTVDISQWQFEWIEVEQIVGITYSDWEVKLNPRKGTYNDNYFAVELSNRYLPPNSVVLMYEKRVNSSYKYVIIGGIEESFLAEITGIQQIDNFQPIWYYNFREIKYNTNVTNLTVFDSKYYVGTEKKYSDNIFTKELNNIKVNVGTIVRMFSFRFSLAGIIDDATIDSDAYYFIHGMRGKYDSPIPLEVDMSNPSADTRAFELDNQTILPNVNGELVENADGVTLSFVTRVIYDTVNHQFHQFYRTLKYDNYGILREVTAESKDTIVTLSECDDT